MAFDVVMPQMGESIAEATVLKWHKQVGDVVAKDDTLYEISTDKVDAEIPAPAAGTLLEILVDVNITVPVGTVVARIGDASEKAAGAPVPPPASATPVEQVAAAAIIQAPLEDDNSLEGRLKSKSSPLVREMAKQHGVDLAKVQGTARPAGLPRRTWRPSSRRDLQQWPQLRCSPSPPPCRRCMIPPRRPWESLPPWRFPPRPQPRPSRRVSGSRLSP